MNARAQGQSPEVLIVGAGPVGMTAALTLVRAGVPVRIIDKRSGPSVFSKALAVGARTMEVLDRLELADEVVANSVRVSETALYRDGELISKVSLEQEDSRFGMHFLPQSRTEAILLGALERLGVEVEWNAELERIERLDDFCRVAVRAGESVDVSEVPWVIGSDGGRSFVRTALGVPFEGRDLPGLFRLADVRFDRPWEAEMGAMTSPGHVVAVFPLDDGWVRLVTQVESEDVVADPQPVLQAEVAACGFEHRIVEMGWASSFRVRSRVAANYRVGRVFLAGDAAHTHSPLGGQGMNMGIQDAFNLAWKLAGVIHGRFGDVVLDSYESERRPVALRIVDVTHRATALVLGRRDRLVVGAMSLGARVLSSLEEAQAVIAGQATALDQRYSYSPIIDEDSIGFIRPPSPERPSLLELIDFRRGPTAGMRAPDAAVLNRDGVAVRLFDLFEGERHTVVFFDGRGDSDEGYQAMVDVRDALERLAPGEFAFALVSPSPALACERTGIPAFADPGYSAHGRYGAQSESAYVVRPDGVIGYRQQPLDVGQVERWAASWVASVVCKPRGLKNPWASLVLCPGRGLRHS